MTRSQVLTPYVLSMFLELSQSNFVTESKLEKNIQPEIGAETMWVNNNSILLSITKHWESISWVNCVLKKEFY